MKVFILAVLPLLMSSPLFAQSQSPNHWTLEQCIDFAIKNNLTVKYYDVSIRQKEVALNTAQMSLLPVVSGGASQSFGFGRALTSSNTYEQRNTSNTSFSIGASAVLFQGFYRKNNISASRLNLNVAKLEQENVKNDLTLNIISAYLKILLADELMQVNSMSLGLSREQLAMMARQRDLGRRTDADVISARAVIVRDSASYVSSLNDYKLSILELCQLMELDEDSFSIQPPDGNVEFCVLDSPEQVFDIASHDRPEIKSAELRSVIAERQTSIARSNFFPTLKVSAGLSSNYYKTDGWANASFANQIRNNFSQSVTFSLSVPIFSAFSSRNSLQAARLQHEQAEIQLNVERNSLKKAIEQAFFDVSAAQSSYVSCLLADSVSLDAYNIVHTKFVNGKSSRLELDEARYDWLKAESSLVVAKYELLLKLKIWDFYRGQF